MGKIRTKTGDIFKIQVDESHVCFGQVIKNIGGVLRIVTFEKLYGSDESPDVNKILSDKIILLTDTMDAKIYYGDWKVYLNSPSFPVNLPKPYFKLGLDPIYITDYDGKRIRVATKDEESYFDFKFSVAPIRIQNAMLAFFNFREWDTDFDKLTYQYCLERSVLK